tara:strand:+ start:377 stop:718 length:342 start_codon:yes stop_codon:yes gene_type:complete
MSKIGEIFENFNTWSNYQSLTTKRLKLAVNLFIVLVLPIILILNNAEVFLVLSAIIPFYLSLQYLFEGDMNFGQRWMKMFKVFMLYFAIILVAIVIIENFLPSLAPMIYYTIK